MYPSIAAIAEVERARRRAAEHRAAHWRWVRASSSLHAPGTPRSEMWHQPGLLARIRDRWILRARLRALATH